METANKIEHFSDNEDTISPFTSLSSTLPKSQMTKMTTTTVKTKTDTPIEQHLVKTNTISAMYNSVKENALTHSDYYLYAISIVLLVGIVILLYFNYTTMSANSFLWMVIQFVFVVINSWINTVSFLQKNKTE